MCLNFLFLLDKESFYPLIDVNWWADGAVTLARCSGALTVSSSKSLKNLLGKSCEWFEPSPQVTATHDGGFLSLEVRFLPVTVNAHCVRNLSICLVICVCHVVLCLTISLTEIRYPVNHELNVLYC